MSCSVDLTNLREMTDGDAELERELYLAFLQSSEECLAHLRASCNAGAEAEWRKHAHAWKGISVNLGAESLGRLCKDAQERCAASVQDKLQMLADLQREYEQVKLYLQEQP